MKKNRSAIRIPMPLRYVINLILIVAVWFVLNSLIQSGVITNYWSGILITVGINIILATSLNVATGYLGQLPLGHAGFMAVGAYAGGIFMKAMPVQELLKAGNTGAAIPYILLALLISAIVAGIFGIIIGIPALRLRGDYLAIVTLGFGEIIRLVLNNWVSFTGGPNGVPVPSPTLFGLEFTRRAKDGGIPIHEFFHVSYNPNLKFIFLYAVLCLVVMLVLLVKHRLTRMPIGRAWEALREDEIACRAMGLNHVLVKLSAFMLGASTAGIAGVFFASYQGFVNPTSFTFFESALILAIVVLGGMGSTLGVVLAAFVLTVTPELLRGFDEYRVLLFGVLMVMMMIWRPRGLVRTSRSGVALRKGVAP